MILVSILGSFDSSYLPVFFEFKKQIKHHFIIWDRSNYKQDSIGRIVKAQEDFKSSYEENGVNSLDYKITFIESTFENIYTLFDTVTQFVNDPTNLYLNCSENLNSISLVLSSKVLGYGGKVISYDRYTNFYYVHTKTNIVKKEIQHNLDIKNHLKLKGYSILSYTNKFTLEKRKSHIQEITKNLNQFKQFALNYKASVKRKNFYIDLVNKIELNASESFVKGSIFEEYIYWLIKDNLDVEDIMTGVCIEFEKGLKNEVDVLFIKHNHLHVIECKFSKNFKGSELVYKVDSIMDYMDDDGKGMILSIGTSDKYTYGDKRRAYFNRISLHSVDKFNEKLFLEQVASWFNVEKN